MRKYLRLRIGIVLAVILGSLIYLYPPPGVRERLYAHPASQPKPKGLLPSTLNLGLDLQGGIHLVLGVDVNKALEGQVERTASDMKASLEKKGIGVPRLARQGTTEIAIQLERGQNGVASGDPMVAKIVRQIVALEFVVLAERFVPATERIPPGLDDQVQRDAG